MASKISSEMALEVALYQSWNVNFVITSGTRPSSVEAIADGTELLLDAYRRRY